MSRRVLRCVLAGCLVGAAALVSAADDGAGPKGADELLRLEREWAQAFVKNDAAAVGRVLADDWTVIGEDGDVTDKASFLGEIRSGNLAFEKMDLTDMKVRLYGDSAVVIGRAETRGKYKGEAFMARARWTDVFVRQQGRWQCVASQLTALAKP